MSVDILRFDRRVVVVGGWSVPLLTACEVDGGNVNLVVDNRIGVLVSAVNFDDYTAFVADVIGVCFGYGAHPRDDKFDRSRFAACPHPTLAPRRMVEIGSIEPTALSVDATGGTDA